MKQINVILLYFFYASLTTACSVHKFNPVTTDPATEEANPALVQAGKRNFWEVNAAMATVVGMSPEDHLAVTAGTRRNAGSPEIPANTPNIPASLRKVKQTWDKVNTMMARKNNIDGCDPGTQVGIFRLASAHCDRLILDDSTAWNNFVKQNFDGEDISKLSKSDVAAIMLDSLQTGSRLNQKQREKSLTTIVNYLDDTVTGDSVSKEALFDVCTMVLGSAATMLN